MSDPVQMAAMALPVARTPALPRTLALLLLAAAVSVAAVIGIAIVADRETGLAYAIGLILLGGLVRRPDGSIAPLRQIIAGERPLREIWGLAGTVPLLMLVAGLAVPLLR